MRRKRKRKEVRGGGRRKSRRWRRRSRKRRPFKYSHPTSHNKCSLHYRDQSLNVAATWK